MRKTKKGRIWRGPVAGNAKMKGKSVMVFPCGCCVAYNRKKHMTEADRKKIFEALFG